MAKLNKVEIHELGKCRDLFVVNDGLDNGEIFDVLKARTKYLVVVVMLGKWLSYIKVTA